MKIIDAHCHIFPQKIAARATENIGHFYSLPMEFESGDQDSLLKSGGGFQIEKYVVCSVATKPDQVESINTFIAQACAQHPQFIGLMTLSPDYPDYEKELDRGISLGLKGVKLHSDFQAFDIDDARAFPLYGAIEKRGLPILFHTGDKRYSYSDPERLARVAKLFPNLTCVGAHFGGWSKWERVAAAYEGLANIYFDTSSSLAFMQPQDVLCLIRRFGAERFMFGTDYPMWRHEKELRLFDALGLSKEEREQILRCTAEKIYLKTNC